ncbi:MULTISPECIES: UPF0262 family protein [unclassified Mesorhizobium]|uniref:UPF0262 family protein n=1 Tax=unclassified Mesorhizobium TaxID=325217 RepID=UPI0019292365|nr:MULTISPECIES: UPF0262 family protein [unclassified Mesorhizobium]BCG97349.1 UPF0262 protein y4uD [Mesorhizobium sp. 131-2-1]BCH04420.1 UPF0262 protein y4uD [Mesorhizobium sp. 131-2-5]
MPATAFRLYDVSLGCSLGGADAEILREQALAVSELLESNSFVPIGHGGGPYRLKIDAGEGRLALHITDEDGAHVVSHYLSLSPLRRLLKDYTRMCLSYQQAMRWPGPDRLEAIDVGRRGLHDKAAELLRERLSTKVSIDKDTARRLFTLIYALLRRSAVHRSIVS